MRRREVISLIATATTLMGRIWQTCFEDAGNMLEKVLHGAKPNDLPIQRPEKFDLVINLTTAKALGLEISLQLQQLADEVVE